jgi:hypothetical protein
MTALACWQGRCWRAGPCHHRVAHRRVQREADGRVELQVSGGSFRRPVHWHCRDLVSATGSTIICDNVSVLARLSTAARTELLGSAAAQRQPKHQPRRCGWWGAIRTRGCCNRGESGSGITYAKTVSPANRRLADARPRRARRPACRPERWPLPAGILSDRSAPAHHPSVAYARWGRRTYTSRSRRTRRMRVARIDKASSRTGSDLHMRCGSLHLKIRQTSSAQR